MAIGAQDGSGSGRLARAALGAALGGLAGIAASHPWLHVPADGAEAVLEAADASGARALADAVAALAADPTTFRREVTDGAVATLRLAAAQDAAGGPGFLRPARARSARAGRNP